MLHLTGSKVTGAVGQAATLRQEQNRYMYVLVVLIIAVPIFSSH